MAQSTQWLQAIQSRMKKRLTVYGQFSAQTAQLVANSIINSLGARTEIRNLIACATAVA